MCVSPDRASFLSRPAFLGALAAAAAPFAGGVTGLDAAAAQDGAGSAVLPPPRGTLGYGDAIAAALARLSPVAQAAYARADAQAGSIGDARLRDTMRDLIRSSHLVYADRHPGREARVAVRDSLARAGFVAADAPVRGIFPAVTEPASPNAPQPFWSAPGSGEGSHHAYPGGLAIHESFNAAIADQYTRTYDTLYFGGRPTISRDTVIAAALYHDVAKTVVFGWNDDGTLAEELSVAGTGAHHILSAAEAIVRGHDARFVTTLLAAHAAPSLGDEAKVVAWARAAAIVAGVDAIDYGLVRRNGSAYVLGADPAPLEAFVNFLSDHDFVVSIHAAHIVGERLRARYERGGAAAALMPTFAWYRAGVLSRTPALTLYDVLARRGADAFERAAERAEANLTPFDKLRAS